MVVGSDIIDKCVGTSYYCGVLTTAVDKQGLISLHLPLPYPEVADSYMQLWKTYIPEFWSTFTHMC